MHQPNSNLDRLFLRSLDYTHTHTHTPRRTILNECSFRPRSYYYLYNKNTSHEHALSGIRARDPNNRAAADLALPGSSVAIFLFVMPWQSVVSQGLLIIEVWQSHSDTSHFARLFWTNDQPDAELSTWQHTTVARDRHPCPRRNSKPQSQQGSDGRPTP
jgi:hypothetical protein